MSKNGKCSGNTHTVAQMNHHANQCNPNNNAYVAATNNHANQCNPNNSVSNKGNDSDKKKIRKVNYGK